MSKRLAAKQPPRRPRTPGRTVRSAGPRPNRFHSFLRRLSAGGRSNMYGAIPYLMDTFALDRESAFRIVCEWVDQQQTERSTSDAQASTGGEGPARGRLSPRTEPARRSRPTPSAARS